MPQTFKISGLAEEEKQEERKTFKIAPEKFKIGGSADDTTAIQKILRGAKKIIEAPSTLARKILTNDPLGTAADIMAQAPREMDAAPRSLLGGAMTSGSHFMGMIDRLSDRIANTVGLPPESKGGLFKQLSENWGYWGQKLRDEGMSPGIIKDIVEAAGGATFDIASIGALGGMAPTFALKGAAEDENALRGAARGAAEGLLMHNIFKALNLVPRPTRVPVGGLVMAGLTPGSFQERLTSAIVGAGLTWPGGKGPTWKEFSEAYQNLPQGRELVAYRMLQNMTGPMRMLGIELTPEYAQRAGGYGAVIDRIERGMENYAKAREEYNLSGPSEAEVRAAKKKRASSKVIQYQGRFVNKALAEQEGILPTERSYQENLDAKNAAALRRGIPQKTERQAQIKEAEEYNRQVEEARMAEAERQKNLTPEARDKEAKEAEQIDLLAEAVNNNVELAGAYVHNEFIGGLDELESLVDSIRAGSKSREVAIAEIRESVSMLTDAMFDQEVRDTTSKVKAVADEDFKKTIVDVRESDRQKKEAGFFLVEKPILKKDATPTPPEQALIEQTYRRGMNPYRIIDKLKKTANTVVDQFKSLMVFEHRVKDQPKFVNELRIFKDSAVDAGEFADKMVVNTAGRLSPQEEGLFEMMIGLKDLIWRSETGRTTPGRPKGMTEAEWVLKMKAALASYEKSMTPEVEAALKKHGEYVQLVGQDLVARGKIDPKAIREDYFHHRVMDYTPEWTNYILPRRFKTPFRHYAVKAKGSLKPIDFDYIQAMRDYYTHYYMDNAIEDFWRNSAVKYDLIPRLAKGSLKTILREQGRLYPGKLIDFQGKKYKVFQFDPGNTFYKAETIPEKTWRMAIQQGWSIKDLQKHTEEVFAMGGKKKMVLLPETIADRLERFRIPAGDLPMFWNVKGFVSAWKRLTLDVAGIPFQINNFLGDAINLYRADPAAFTKVREAFGTAFREMFRPEKMSAEELRLTKLAQEQRVSTTYLLRETGADIIAEEALKKFTRPQNALDWIGEALMRIPKGIEKISTAREMIFRYSKFMKDVERIESGKSVVAGDSDIRGLSPIEAAGKAAREFTVDYGAVTPAYSRFLRGFIAPFMTFYDYNARGWYKYMTKRPGNFLAKFMVPTAMMFIWNNTGERKKDEENLGFWRWMPHVNTGYKTKDGKAVILSFQTPFEMALQFTGLNRLPAKITDVRAGKMTTREALVEQLKDIYRSPAESSFRLLGVWLLLPLEIAQNKDIGTGKQIVTKDFQGTKYEADIVGRHILNRLFAPYMQYKRMQSEIEASPKYQDFGKILTKGPIGILSALGYRAVDIDMRRLSELYQQRDEGSKEIMNKLAQIEMAYLDSVNKKGDLGIEFLSGKGKEIIVQGGPMPTPEQVIRRLSKPAVQIKALTILAKNTKDEEGRKQILETIKQYRQIESYDDFTKHTMLGQKSDILVKYIQIMADLARKRAQKNAEEGIR